MIAHRYGVLPSTLIQLSPEDYQFNLLVTDKAIEDEVKRYQKQVPKRRR